MSTDQSDESLMVAFAAGDSRAFEILLGRHRRGVYNFIRRQVGPGPADDLLQEVFLRVIRSAKDYERQAKFTTWLYTIAHHLCVDSHRRAAFRRAESLDAPAGEDGRPREVADVTEPGGERRAIGSEAVARLEAALAALPQEQREVFLLREKQDLSFQEIAVVVGCPVNTVKSRMRYALERLRAALADFAEAAGGQAAEVDAAPAAAPDAKVAP